MFKLPTRSSFHKILRCLQKRKGNTWGGAKEECIKTTKQDNKYRTLVEKLIQSPIRPPKSIKDRLKNLSPIKPEQLKQKSQAPINQAGKIQMNAKVNKLRPRSTFKMLSRTKSPIRIKRCNPQGSTKPLQRTYRIENMGSDTDRIAVSLNLEKIINNYNTRNYLTVGRLQAHSSF